MLSAARVLNTLSGDRERRSAAEALLSMAVERNATSSSDNAGALASKEASQSHVRSRFRGHALLRDTIAAKPTSRPPALAGSLAGSTSSSVGSPIIISCKDSCTINLEGEVSDLSDSDSNAEDRKVYIR